MTCLHPECKSDRFARGVCKSHYKLMHRLVQAGQTSWATLEANGRVLPSKKGRLTETLVRQRSWKPEVLADMLRSIADAYRTGTIVAKSSAAVTALTLAVNQFQPSKP